MHRCLLILLFLLLLNQYLAAQQQGGYQQLIEDLAEELIQEDEGISDMEQLLEKLEYLNEHPINLNNTNANELEPLRILSDFQVLSLLDYIEKNQGMASIYELRLVEGFNQVTIKKLLPFVFVGPVKPEKEQLLWNKALKYGSNNVFLRSEWVAEKPEGYREVEGAEGYPGNRQKLYARYKFNYKQKLKWGFTAEKDPGEQFFDGHQKRGFDFYSAHLQIEQLGLIKTAVLGDFKASFGQGLIAASQFGGGKSVYVMDIRKRNQGINKYSSADENLFFRGGATTLEWNQFELSAFFSHKKMNANVAIDNALGEDSIHFTSFYTLGVHATPNQIEKKDAMKETVVGGNITYSQNRFRMGITTMAYQYNIPLLIDNSPKNQFDFTGQNNLNLSADAQYRFNNIHLFTEAAISKNGGAAALAGALLKLSSRVQTSVLYRNYSKDFQAFYGNAFAESSTSTNEKGIYLGLAFHPLKKWKVSAYYDFFRFPWLTYQASSPSKGTDYLIQADFVPNRKLSMYWRYKNEIKQADGSQPVTEIPALVDVLKQQLRYHAAFNLTEQWKFRNRVEWSHYRMGETGENGIMLYQDIIYSPVNRPLSLYLRYAVFDTDSYQTRIYAYESDVLYAFSIPAYYNKGSRAYAMVKYQVTDGVHLWLKVGQTWYANQKSIGSGLNEIKDNKKTNIKVQLRWNF